MRRPAAATTGLLVGAVLLIGARLAARTPVDLGTVTTSPPTATATATPSAAPSSPGPTRSPRPRRATPAPPDASKTPAGESTPDDEPPAPPSGTFAGGAVTHRYGTLRVTVTLADGQITEVRTDYSTSSPVSTRINDDALPVLRQETLAAQSARVDTVSGATYTSDAYRDSLQSALDQAGW